MTRRQRGRPSSGIVTMKVELNLPHDLVMWLNAHFYNPRTGKARYGERTKLVERLLREYQHKCQRPEVS